MQIISEVEKKLKIRPLIKIAKRRYGDNDKSICDINKAKKYWPGDRNFQK